MLARSRWFLARTVKFCSIGRMNIYVSPSQNAQFEQGPARSSREFMKHPGECSE